MAYNLPNNWKDIFRDNAKNLRVRGDNALGLCPFHDDRRNSFSVNVLTSQWLCFAGCGKGNYFDFKRLIEGGGRPTPLEPPKQPRIESETPKNGIQEKVEKTYIYRKVDGEPSFEVDRMDPKSFRQHKVGGFNMEGVERIPYNLDQVWKRREEVCFWVEGEKDTDNLMNLGILASTSPGGANGWKDELALKIPNDFLVVIPDQDFPGHSYAVQVIESLQKHHKTVLQWDTPTKDISDLLEHKKELTAKDIKALAWREGNFYFSKENPFEYFTRQGIPIDKWSDLKGDRSKFLRKQLQTIYGFLPELLDPHHPKVIDIIDRQAKVTRDSENYTMFCRGLMYLHLVSEFYAKLY